MNKRTSLRAARPIVVTWLSLAVILTGCYTATPTLQLATDPKSVNPRPRESHADEKANEEKNAVNLRVLYLMDTADFQNANFTRLWPKAGHLEASSIKGANAVVDLPVAAGESGRAQLVEVKLDAKADNGQRVAFQYVGVTANFADQNGTWRICIPKADLDKFRIQIRGRNLETVERRPAEKAKQ